MSKILIYNEVTINYKILKEICCGSSESSFPYEKGED